MADNLVSIGWVAVLPDGTPYRTRRRTYSWSRPTKQPARIYTTEAKARAYSTPEHVIKEVFVNV